VAFPLFGKKTPPSPLSGKAPARPAAKPAANTGQDELGSLDFTQPGEMLASRGAQIEVLEEEHQLPAAIEQAAMLYSVEQPDSACTPLETAIRDNGRDLGSYAPRAWGMLFELYQLLDRQHAFEHLALEYAARFETSPPTWTGHGSKSEAPAAASGGRMAVSLTGVLNAKADDILKSLLRLAEKNPSVRLELGKVTDADEQGCALVCATLRQLRKAGKDCALGGADKLAGILAKKIVPGQREHEPIWLLLLDLYQELAVQEAFEDTAVNYAVTFEVSPPSWEPVKTKIGKSASAASGAQAAPAVQEKTSLCALEGTITAADDGNFATIRAAAESNNDIVVDASRLQRMDFVSAANLMNLATALLATQKKLRLVKVSHLVAALWEVIGLDRVARIETRKT
jgi:anti-anti-sigma regulatory factor